MSFHNKDDGLDDENVKLIHDFVDELSKEGFVVTGCRACKDQHPPIVARCRFCGQICYPKDQMNN